MYADTSVLVKLLVPESDSAAWAVRIGSEPLVSSELAYAETSSALLFKQRAGSINLSQRQQAWAHFERQIAEKRISLLPLDRAVVCRAHEVMLGLHDRVSLRTLDAIHLATAGSIVDGPFFTNDRPMRKAAKLMGLAVVDLT